MIIFHIWNNLTFNKMIFDRLFWFFDHCATTSIAKLALV